MDHAIEPQGHVVVAIGLPSAAAPLYLLWDATMPQAADPCPRFPALPEFLGHPPSVAHLQATGERALLLCPCHATQMHNAEQFSMEALPVQCS